MEFGRSGPLGVCAHSLVVEAKELGQGHVSLPSMGEDHVMDLKRSISLAILLFVLVSIYRITVCYLHFFSSIVPLWFLLCGLSLKIYFYSFIEILRRLIQFSVFIQTSAKWWNLQNNAHSSMYQKSSLDLLFIKAVMYLDVNLIEHSGSYFWAQKHRLVL